MSLFDIFKTPKQPAGPAAFDGVVVSAAADEVAPVMQCTDDVFAQEMMGTGFVVKPQDGNIVSPVPGTVELVFNTLHAFGLKTSDGHEVLVHVGIDTVELGGAPFTAKVEKGQVVAAGDALATADLAAIEAAGKSTEVVVVLSGTPAEKFTLERTGSVAAGEAVGRYV